MKKFLVFALTAAMLLSMVVIGTSAADVDVWDGTVATSFSAGTGTEADPYVIATAEELAYLAAKVQAGDPATGEYYVLATDLDLAKLEWTPIGIYIKSGNEANCSFAGSFDGQGHTISGLSVTTTDATIFCGLFGRVDTEGYLKNLIIADSNITAESNSAGALGGRITAKEISSIVVKEDVTTNGTSSVGGVAGRIIGADAKYLVSYATVITSTVDSGCFGGGIAATLGGGATLSYSANFGSVSGVGAFHGGLVGITGGDSGSGSIYNCVNFGDVTYNGEKSWYVGGIAGCFGHTDGHDYINENCYNFGKISAGYAEARVGEIIGESRKGNINMKSLYSIDIENVEAIGKESKAPVSYEDVVTKTEAELQALADAIVATIEANIVTPTVEPEVTEPEVTEPEVTEPVEPAPTGDSALIFVVIAVLSAAAAAVVAKKRVNE